MRTFCLDSDNDIVWSCISFDRPWNGWATPVVDRETMLDVIETAGWFAEANGSTYRVREDDDDDEILLHPDSDDLYHLSELGWTFVKVEDSPGAQVIPFPRN